MTKLVLWSCELRPTLHIEARTDGVRQPFSSKNCVQSLRLGHSSFLTPNRWVWFLRENVNRVTVDELRLFGLFAACLLPVLIFDLVCYFSLYICLHLFVSNICIIYIQFKNSSDWSLSSCVSCARDLQNIQYEELEKIKDVEVFCTDFSKASCFGRQVAWCGRCCTELDVVHLQGPEKIDWSHHFESTEADRKVSNSKVSPQNMTPVCRHQLQMQISCKCRASPSNIFWNLLQNITGRIWFEQSPWTGRQAETVSIWVFIELLELHELLMGLVSTRSWHPRGLARGCWSSAFMTKPQTTWDTRPATTSVGLWTPSTRQGPFVLKSENRLQVVGGTKGLLLCANNDSYPKLSSGKQIHSEIESCCRLHCCRVLISPGVSFCALSNGKQPLF